MCYISAESSYSIYLISSTSELKITCTNVFSIRSIWPAYVIILTKSNNEIPILMQQSCPWHFLGNQYKTVCLMHTPSFVMSKRYFRQHDRITWRFYCPIAWKMILLYIRIAGMHVGVSYPELHQVQLDQFTLRHWMLSKRLYALFCNVTIPYIPQQWKFRGRKFAVSVVFR